MYMITTHASSCVGLSKMEHSTYVYGYYTCILMCWIIKDGTISTQYRSSHDTCTGAKESWSSGHNIRSLSKKELEQISGSGVAPSGFKLIFHLILVENSQITSTVQFSLTSLALNGGKYFQTLHKRHYVYSAPVYYILECVARV